MGSDLMVAFGRLMLLGMVALIVYVLRKEV